jgi:hypothetical protein
MQNPPPGFSQYPRGNQGTGYIPLQGPGVHFNLFSKAWEVVKANATVFVLGFIVVGIIAGFVSLPANLLQNYLAYGSLTDTSPQNLNPVGLIIGTFITSIVGLITSCLYYGISSAAVEYAETGSVQFESIFRGVKHIGQIIIFGLIYGFGVTIGVVFCIIPGLVIATALAFAPMAIIHENLNAVEAIQVTWERTKPHIAALIAFNLIGGLIIFVGALLCLVGLLATIPIYYVAVGLQYRELRGPVMVAGNQRDFNSQVPPTL